MPAAPVPRNGYSELFGVAAASPSDIWAVGEAENNIRADKLRTVTEHWNGRAWTLVPSPSLGTKSALDAVAVTSNHQAWAAGGGQAQAVSGGPSSSVAAAARRAKPSTGLKWL